MALLSILLAHDLRKNGVPITSGLPQILATTAASRKLREGRGDWIFGWRENNAAERSRDMRVVGRGGCGMRERKTVRRVG